MYNVIEKVRKFIKNLYVSGYRSYEVGVFSNDDPKLFYIKEFFKRRLIGYIESGLEWVIISGNLGTEQWVAEVVLDLKETYPEIRLGILLPYLEFAGNWNEGNQALFNEIIQKADYTNYTSNKPYENPGQLKNNQAFIIQNTDGCLLFYDVENEGKVSFVHDMALLYQENHPYEIEKVGFDELQWFVNDLEEL